MTCWQTGLYFLQHLRPSHIHISIFEFDMSVFVFEDLNLIWSCLCSVWSNRSLVTPSAQLWMILSFASSSISTQTVNKFPVNIIINHKSKLVDINENQKLIPKHRYNWWIHRSYIGIHDVNGAWWRDWKGEKTMSHCVQ